MALGDQEISNTLAAPNGGRPRFKGVEVRSKNMKSRMHQILAILALNLFLGACDTSSSVEMVGTDDILDSAAKSSPSTPENSTAQDLVVDSIAAFSCGTCYVRCSNAAPRQCKWTRVYNLGFRNDCGGFGGAGDNFCAHNGYTNSWAGCTKAGTTHPGCCCDPDGYCSQC
jgi:hypothetical protein